MHEEYKEMPTNAFDARLSEELDERLEFYGWSFSETYCNSGSCTTAGYSSC